MEHSNARQTKNSCLPESIPNQSIHENEDNVDNLFPHHDTDPVEIDASTLHASDFSWATSALKSGRDAILLSWLEASKTQAFHRSHPDRVVSDDIPRLFDAVVEYLAHASNTWHDPGAPMDYPAILAAANSHALNRAEQGLQPSDVVTEFRLLRRAVWKGLRDRIDESQPTDGLINAELLVNDALDGAITVGLSALTSHIEKIREDFLVSTIHDIRQPITAIKGLAQLSSRYLSRQDPDIERTRAVLVDIMTQIDKLNGTIDFLVDVSRASLGELSLHESFVDLTQLLPEIVEQNGMHHIRELRLTLPEEGVATGYWDPDRIRQVIDNLLSNALKYSDPGSLIAIDVRASNESVEVLVRDFGMGLEAQELPKIFRRYYRTASAIESDTEGSGIGLYLCAQIVEALSGRIWAESDGPGHGSVIRFTLPRKLEQLRSARSGAE